MITPYNVADIPSFTKGDIRRAGEVLKQSGTKLQSAQIKLKELHAKLEARRAESDKIEEDLQIFANQFRQFEPTDAISKLNELQQRYNALQQRQSDIDQFRQAIEKIVKSLEAAIKVVQQWRDLHRYPLNTLQSLFRNIIRREQLENLKIGQRQKRLISIVNKLSSNRFHGSLEEMQDIAGIRILTPDMKSLRLMQTALEKSRSKQKIRYQRDYILKPKPDGYRGIHLIYKTYLPKAPEPIRGMQVELQIRTRLQHYWATAVESVDMFYGEALKTGKGTENWKAFFLLASAAFSLIEHSPLPEAYCSYSEEQIAAWLQDMENETRPFSKLNKIIEHAIKQDVKVQDHPYHVLLFAKQEGKILPATSIGFADEESAQSYYAFFEQKQLAAPESNDLTIQDVVLVKTDKKELKTLYSNYFLDIEKFLKRLETFTAKHGFPIVRVKGEKP